MKKLYYEEGPRVMGCGAAGEFRIGEPKEVPDDLAEILLRKGRHKEWQEPAAKWIKDGFPIPSPENENPSPIPPKRRDK